MSTKDPNPTVTRNWGVYVNAGEDFTLSLIRAAVIEWRVTATDTPIATAITGHPLSPFDREGLNRALSGPGYAQLRIAPSQSETEAEIALTTWTPTP